MDKEVSRIFRDENVTAKEAALFLNRLGHDKWDMISFLVKSKKVKSDPGYAHQVLVDLNLIDLDEAREDVAQWVFEDYEYPEEIQVVHAGRWDGSDDSWYINVHIEYEGDDQSTLTSFAVDFEDNKCIPTGFDANY